MQKQPNAPALEGTQHHRPAQPPNNLPLSISSDLQTHAIHDITADTHNRTELHKPHDALDGSGENNSSDDTYGSESINLSDAPNGSDQTSPSDAPEGSDLKTGVYVPTN